MFKNSIHYNDMTGGRFVCFGCHGGKIPKKGGCTFNFIYPITVDKLRPARYTYDCTA